MRGGLMVCGTASDVGKSQVVTGLCRLLARQGVRVAPFKAQNMALNSYVTPSGHEIGRAQGVQALAAGVEPEVAMNPILLKPSGERTSQVVLNGVAAGEMSAAEYHRHKPALLSTVLAALDDLRSRFDVVIAEGAGSPTEINLLAHDIVNLPIAAEAGLAALVVGDIDRGGVFAALYGTVGLLPERLRSQVRGFVINKFRGDPALLGDGLDELASRTGVPTLGVIPWVPGLVLDAEDSLALTGPRPRAEGRGDGDLLDVAALRFPRLSNFTDLDALAIEPGVHVRLVETVAALGDPDLLILPGTKATVLDLDWLRREGFDHVVRSRAEVGGPILGVCGGYQMLGLSISDEVESGRGRVEGLGALPVQTRFEAQKVTRQRRGSALGAALSGYEIHHGRIEGDSAEAWIELSDRYGTEFEGARSADGALLGTSLHGLFEEDGFRSAFLAHVAGLRAKRWGPSGVSFAAAREAQFDRLADLLEEHLDLPALAEIIAEGAPGGPPDTA